jgi:hypothetical protein
MKINFVNSLSLIKNLVKQDTYRKGGTEKHEYWDPFKFRTPKKEVHSNVT